MKGACTCTGAVLAVDGICRACGGRWRPNHTPTLIAWWLNSFGSHSIVVLRHLDELEKCGVSYDVDARTLTVKGYGWAHLPISTGAEMIARIESRGLGGSVAKDFDRSAFYFTGWDIAEAFASAMGVGGAGGQYFGRGRRHAACIEAIGALE